MINYINNHAASIQGYAQSGISWRYTENHNEHPVISAAISASNDFSSFVNTLNDLIDRKTIADFFKKDMLYEGFMATMLWGHKHLNGITAKRDFLFIVKMPKADIVSKMEDVKKLIDGGNYHEAFDSLHQQNKIKYVGEAFYTKLLYFMTSDNPRPLLILDSNMHLVWCALKIANGDMSYKTTYEWNSTKKKLSKINNYNDNNWNTYSDYLNTMYGVTPNAAKPDELEAFLFRDTSLPNEQISPRQFVVNYIDINFSPSN